MAHIETTQQQTSSDTPEAVHETAETPAEKRHGRHLIIRVSENGQSKANIRLPLGLARAGLKFMPAKEKENLKAQGIDVEELLGELTGDEEGELVQVDDEGKHVWIGVE